MKKISWRTIIIGLLLCACLSIIEPYGALVYANTGLCADFINAGAVILLFFLILIGNQIFKLKLNQQELIVIYIMLIIACTIPSWGLVSNLLPILSGLYYYGFVTPEFKWPELIHPHIPSWIAPRDNLVNKYFFEGLPNGESAPYAAWILPLSLWCLFIFALYFVMICIVNIIRKQWVENEKLIFALNTPTLEMTRDDKPVFKNPLMWIGFFISFSFIFYNGLAHFFPVLTPITLNKWYPIFRYTTNIVLTLCFPIFALTYFVNLDVSFSIWFFHLIDRVINGFSGITGFDGGTKGHIEVFCDTLPFITHMNIGAMIVLVGYGLWLGRKHLKNVFQKAFFNDKNIDDSQEMLSYRTSVLGLFLGLIVICVWLYFSGMKNLLFIFMFVFSMFVIFTAMTRIVAEGGLGFARAPGIPSVFCAYGLPTASVSPSNITSLGFTYSYAGDIRTILMTSTVHGLKLADDVKANKRRLFLAIVLAIIVTLFVSLYITLKISYKYGGLTHQGGEGWFFHGLEYVGSWGFVVDKLRHPVTSDMVIPRWIWTVIGGGFMYFLMFMRHRFFWWPLHYIGFPIAGSYVMMQSWFSIFLGWLIKASILKLGGVKVYRQLSPLFIGLILGQLVCAGLWVIVKFIVGDRSSLGVWIGVP